MDQGKSTHGRDNAAPSSPPGSLYYSICKGKLSSIPRNPQHVLRGGVSMAGLGWRSLRRRSAGVVVDPEWCSCYLVVHAYDT